MKRNVLQYNEAFQNHFIYNKIVTQALLKGKKTISTKIIFKILKDVKVKHNKSPIFIMFNGIQKMTPIFGVKKKVVKRKAYYLPKLTDSDSRTRLAAKWFISSNKSKGTNISLTLTRRIIELDTPNLKGKASKTYLDQFYKSVLNSRPLFKFI